MYVYKIGKQIALGTELHTHTNWWEEEYNEMLEIAVV